MTARSKEYDFFKLYDGFVSKTRKGIRVQKNGRLVRTDSIGNYGYVRKLLLEFSIEKKYSLRIRSVSHLRSREVLSEEKYWEKFYRSFTDYMYEDCDCYDNYVGSTIKLLRGFFNYLNTKLHLDVGDFHKNFYAPHEEIEIITLTPEQLNFLTYDAAYRNSLPEHLKRTLDVFVLGCTVALRFSDIFKLTTANIESVNGNYYLKVTSQKTTTFTRVKLPDYAVEIVTRYMKKGKILFPTISKHRFNHNIRELVKLAGWDHECIVTRKKKGIPVMQYKNVLKKEMYRFYDLVSSHTMRRTAITTMLCLEMPESIVRKISGHAANSKEFFRYVEISQKYNDTETDKVHLALKNRKFVGNEPEMV